MAPMVPLAMPVRDAACLAALWLMLANDLFGQLRVADVAPGGAVADVPGNAHQRSPISSGRVVALPAGVTGRFQRRRPADDG